MRLSLPLSALDGRFLGRAVWKIERALEEAKDQTGIGPRQRILVVLAAFCLVYAVLAAGAIKAALLNPDARADAYAPLPAGARADLVDRNGELLAANLLHYGLFIDPREIWDEKETEAGLTKILPAASDRILKALHGARRTRVVGGLTPSVRDQIRALGLPGVSFEDEEARIYPLGAGGVHLIGFTDSGGKGLGGAEMAFDSELAGATKPVALSIDLRIQAALDEEVGKAFTQFHPLGAVGMVIDTQTGEILGMSNWPNYDPNQGGSLDQRQNRAANALYEMGSTFKAFTIAAGLDSGAVTTASRFDATHPITITLPGGRRRIIHDMHGEKGGVMSVVDIFTNSSNVGTAQIAERIGR
ncbi:MAG: penicillin-binding protein 2, partial [Caulobacteraceae bacterium]|nr:penicillin-binding protein 2 [Caulobacteraceae bacterium]